MRVVCTRVRVATALAASAAGCGRLGFEPHLDAGRPAAIDAAPLDAADTPAVDAAGYHATAVRFQTAGNDYLWTGSLASTVDSGSGTYSVWLRFTGGDGTQQLISVAKVIGIGGVLRESNGHLRFLMQNCAGFPLLDMQTAGTYTTSSGWIHVLASWNLTLGRADLYVDDVPDRAANPTVVAGNLCYASLEWGIGGLGAGQMDADVADLYAALGTYLDLTSDANRRRFSTAAGKPVDLGASCVGPTGARPTGCFVGAAATWNVNQGVAGGFTLAGDGLSPAPTSPSD